MAELESLKEPANTKSIIIKFIISLALGILVMMMPRPETLTPEGHRLLALLTTIVFLWVSEAVP
ncbi:MAG: sodium/sulfate symporter, partial [Desulfotignum sp.]|nr:sodium/sulfate symporter [Desulfotignum sp.]